MIVIKIVRVVRDVFGENVLINFRFLEFLVLLNLLSLINF